MSHHVINGLSLSSQEDDDKKRSTEMYSLSENVAKKVLKKTPLDFISFNTGQKQSHD